MPIHYLRRCFCILYCIFILKHSEKTQIRSHAHGLENESRDRIGLPQSTLLNQLHSITVYQEAEIRS